MQPAFHKSGGIFWQSWDEMDKEDSQSRAEPSGWSWGAKKVGDAPTSLAKPKLQTRSLLSC